MAVRTKEGLSRWIRATIGSRQGDPLSPLMFLTILEKMMEKMECNDTGGIEIQGRKIKDLRFADDIDLLAENEEDLQKLTTELHESGKSYGLMINKGKTKVMVMGKDTRADIRIDGENIEQVDQFVYLGSLITKDNNCSLEIKRRIGIAAGTYGSLNEIWKSTKISFQNKLKLLDSCVMSTLLYACEAWTLKKEDKRRLDAFEMRCYRRMLRVKWTERRTNESIRVQINRMKTITTRVLERKMSFFGHICRMKDDRLIKMVVFAKTEGKRKRGRPTRRWVDDIEEWSGGKIWMAKRQAESRQGFWKRR